LDVRRSPVAHRQQIIAPGVNLGLMTRIRPFARVFAVGLLITISAVCRSAAVPVTPDQQRLGRLGPGDLVSIRVYGQPDADSAAVGDDGSMNVPLVGSLQVAGLSPLEAATRVETALKDGGYFVDPHVTIIVTEARSQQVSVTGEVQRVGRYPINPRTTILDLLTQAGGVKETASDVGYVLRTDASGHLNRYPVKLSGPIDLKDILPTPTLLGGDSLLVPRAENIFVQGEVTSPGKFPIEPGMTVIQAIARAGGVNERGSERRIQLRRLGKDGDYHVVPVKPGDLIQGGDIIRVKESIF
jgi:polysaccharide export outer membrane protein